MSNIPTKTPETLQAGDRLQWRIALDDYPASSYALKYYIVKSNSPLITIAASADGDAHLIDVDPTTSASYEAGDYRYVARVEDGGTTNKTIESGPVKILPDFSAQTTGLETRNDWEQIKEAAQATLLGLASKAQSSISVGGKSISQRSTEELTTLIDYCEKQIVKINRAAGRGQTQIIKSAFI